jgi:hypothetical protein
MHEVVSNYLPDMNLIAAVSSSSEQSMHKPLAGIAFKPFLATANVSAKPFAKRASQAATSPFLGAPAIPAVWQEVQVPLKISSPERGPEETATAGPPQSSP